MMETAFQPSSGDLARVVLEGAAVETVFPMGECSVPGILIDRTWPEIASAEQRGRATELIAHLYYKLAFTTDLVLQPAPSFEDGILEAARLLGRGLSRVIEPRGDEHLLLDKPSAHRFDMFQRTAHGSTTRQIEVRLEAILRLWPYRFWPPGSFFLVHGGLWVIDALGPERIAEVADYHGLAPLSPRAARYSGADERGIRAALRVIVDRLDAASPWPTWNALEQQLTADTGALYWLTGGHRRWSREFAHGHAAWA